MTSDTQERSSRGEEEGGNRRADEGDGQDEQAEDPLPPVDTSSVCLVCKKDGAHIQFAAWPCGCPSMCRACAQKLCTGGKCRVCHELFPEIKRCRSSTASAPTTGSSSNH